MNMSKISASSHQSSYGTEINACLLEATIFNFRAKVKALKLPEICVACAWYIKSHGTKFRKA